MGFGGDLGVDDVAAVDAFVGDLSDGGRKRVDESVWGGGEGGL